MNETTSMTYTSAKTGKVYTFDWKRQTRTAYAEFMNPETKYEKVYYQVNVYHNNKRINFGFVDDCNNLTDVIRAVKDVVEWDETPNEVLESMHSCFD